jgi:hypothetical protein
MAPGHHSHRHGGCGNPPATLTHICIVKRRETVINTCHQCGKTEIMDHHPLLQTSLVIKVLLRAMLYMDPHWFQVPTHPNPVLQSIWIQSFRKSQWNVKVTMLIFSSGNRKYGSRSKEFVQNLHINLLSSLSKSTYVLLTI